MHTKIAAARDLGRTSLDVAGMYRHFAGAPLARIARGPEGFVYDRELLSTSEAILRSLLDGDIPRLAR